MSAEAESDFSFSEAMNSIVSSFDEVLLSPVQAASNFISANMPLAASVATLAIMLLGWGMLTMRIDGAAAVKTVMVIVFSFGFYFYLEDAMPDLSNMIENGPSSLSSGIVGRQVSSIDAITQSLSANFGFAWALISQPDTGITNFDFGKSLVGLILWIASLAFAALSLSFFILHTLKLKFMLVIVPVFVLAYSLDATRKLTEGFIQVIVTSFVALFLFGVLQNILSMQLVVPGSSPGFVAYGAMILLAVIKCFFIVQLDSVATSIGGAWQSSVPTGAAWAKGRISNAVSSRRSGGAREGG